MQLEIYFVVFALSLALSIFGSRKSPPFVLLGLLSLGTAWFYIVQYMRTYQGHDAFNDAYRMVIRSIFHTYTSQQLMLSVVPLTVFFYLEQHRERRDNTVATWIFSLLGCLGALSAGFLLYIGQIPALGRNHCKTVPFWLCGFLLISTLSITMAPRLEDPWFERSLLLLHALVIVPPLIASRFTVFYSPLFSNRPSTRASTKEQSNEDGVMGVIVYAAIAGMNAKEHLDMIFAIKGDIITAFQTVWENPCQTSISSDLLFISLATVILIWKDSKLSMKDKLALFPIVLFSPSVLLPVYLAVREYRYENGSTKSK